MIYIFSQPPLFGGWRYQLCPEEVPRSGIGGVLEVNSQRPVFIYNCLKYAVYRNFPLALREALIKSLSDFILVFLFNARNKSTRIASYLRRLMT